MKQILPSEINVGDRICVEQRYEPDGYVMNVGRVHQYEDEYVVFEHDKSVRLNLHPHVGMPNVIVSRLA